MKKCASFQKHALVLSLSIFCTCTGAYAAEQKGLAIQEILVTARSTAESMQDVPVAVTGFTQEDLQRYSTSSLVQLAQQAPELDLYQGAAGSGSAFLVRGVGTSGDDAGLSQAVSLNINNVQVQRSRFLYNAMYDVQQVEVLKGPQALFFGKNSPAGVISIRTTEPGDEANGYIKTGYEFKAEEYWVEGAFGGPITDTFKARIAGRYSDMNEGWVRNIAQPRPDPSMPSVILPGAHEQWGPQEERTAARLTLLWEPTSSFSSNLKIDYGHHEDAGTLSTAELICYGQPLILQPDFSLASDPHSDCSLNGVKATTAIPSQYLEGTIDGKWQNGVPYTEIRTTLWAWTNTVELANYTIKATTGYSELVGSGKDNYTIAEFAAFSGGWKEDFDSFAQEVRLISNYDSPLNFTLGGYYENTNVKEGYDLFLLNFGPDLDTGRYSTSDNHSKGEFDTISIFGQVRYNFSPEWELAVGARWTREKKDTVQSNTYIHYLAPLLGVSSPDRIISSQLKDNNVSPEATLTWHPDDNTTLYVAYKTGYKSGGTAVPSLLTAGNTAENLSFDAEEVKGGEIGYKGSLLDNRMRLDLTAYYYKFKDLQLVAWDPASLSFPIQNAADSKQQGIEGSMIFQVDDNWRLRGSFNWNDLKFDDFMDAPCYAFQTVEQGCTLLPDESGFAQNLTDKRLHRAPEWVGSFGVNYDTNLTDDLMIEFSADTNYKGKYFAGETQNPLSEQEDYWIYNAAVKLYSADNKWELALIGLNLGDERTKGFVQDTAGGGPEMVTAFGSRPLQVSLEGTYRF